MCLRRISDMEGGPGCVDAWPAAYITASALGFSHMLMVKEPPAPRLCTGGDAKQLVLFQKMMLAESGADPGRELRTSSVTHVPKPEEKRSA